jgi:predicted phosphodiesterase
VRKFLQNVLRKPISRLADRLSSSPRKKDVFNSLTALLTDISAHKGDRGLVIPFDCEKDKFIIVSDQHKGGRDLADDFMGAEKNYLAALEYYFDNGYSLVNLGDCEELWENTPKVVMEKNQASMREEARFQEGGRYFRVFGNHDLEWKYLIQQNLYLKPVFGSALKIYEGILLRISHKKEDFHIFLSHGHQGDQRSDGNAFSMWFVAAIWTPIQRFLEVTINTISDSFELVDKHNIMMYEWSATQPNTVFISGHTHKPVFASLDHIDRLARQLEKAKEMNDAQAVALITHQLEKRKIEYAGKKIVKTMAHPSYFNTGCCCFNDGDITGIELEDGFIRLIKWEEEKDGLIKRKVLEEAPLYYIFDQLR